MEFFHLKILPTGIYGFYPRYIFMLFLFCFFFCAGNYWKQNMFAKKILAFCLFFMMLNMITCKLYRDQGFLHSIMAWKEFTPLFLYPVFCSWNKDVNFWEKVIEKLYLLILFCFAVQYIFIKVQIFQLDTDFDYLERETRIRLFSDAILGLGALYALNKYLLSRKLYYALFFIMGTLFIFLQGFRMLLLGYFLSCLILCLRIYKVSLKTFFLFVSASAILYFASRIPIVSDKIDELVNRTETQNFDNEDYIRVECMNYFYTSFFKNDAELVLGSGRAIIDAEHQQNWISQYSRERSNLADYYHYYPVDLGLLGLSWETGIPFVLCFILLILSPFCCKVPESLYYLQMYGFLIVIIGFTHPWSYYHQNTIYLAIVLTILTSYIQREKTEVLISEKKYENRIIKPAL